MNVLPKKSGIIKNDPDTHIDEIISYCYQPEVLVIGPGAEKGYYELGALLELERRNGLKKIKYISTCSIGSIIGLLMVIGLSIKDIIKIFITKNIINVLGDITLMNLKHLIQYGGLYTNDKPKKILTKIVKDKLGYIPNMKQLYIFSGIKLSISITNLNRESPIQNLNCDESLEMSCIDACLMSSNMPIAFERIEYNGETIIDGAWSNPYPIEIYDNGEREVLGIYINDQTYLMPVKDNIQYFNLILSVDSITKRNDSIKKSSDKCYHLGLTTSNDISSYVNPTLIDKHTMLKRGISLARGFLNQIIKLKNNKILI